MDSSISSPVSIDHTRRTSAQHTNSICTSKNSYVCIYQNYTGYKYWKLFLWTSFQMFAWIVVYLACTFHLSNCIGIVNLCSMLIHPPGFAHLYTKARDPLLYPRIRMDYTKPFFFYIKKIYQHSSPNKPELCESEADIITSQPLFPNPPLQNVTKLWLALSRNRFCKFY